MRHKHSSADRSTQTRDWVSGQIATGRRFVPSVPVITHHGANKLFYDDLVKDRTVMVQFMSIAHHAAYPVTRNLMKVQQLLGDRLGREVFLYSITADPRNDTAAALARFAQQHSAGPGWLFLTGDEASLAALKNALFFHGAAHAHHHSVDSRGHDPGAQDKPVHRRDCSMGLMRYGNDAAGLWGSVPTKTDPAMIVERLSWILPRPTTTARPRLKRRGPFPRAPSQRSSLTAQNRPEPD